MDKKPGPRYFDTAYVLYQQWINNQLWTSADNLRFNKQTNKLEIVKFDDEPQPNSKSNGSVKKAKNHKKIKTSNSTNNSNEPKTSNSSNNNNNNNNENLLNTELKIVESLDLVDATNPNVVAPTTQTPVECDNVSTIGNSSKDETTTQKDIVISVDIHQPSNNEAADNGNDDDVAPHNENVPESETNQSSSVSRTSSMRSEQLLTGTEMSVKIKRKKFLNRNRSNDDTEEAIEDVVDRDGTKSELDNTYSSFDESDQDPVYERVEFNKKNFDGNQTIPKSQTFPVTSSNNHLQAVQHHQQPVSPTTKLSDTLRLSYVTERILSSILPKRTVDEQQSFIEDGTNYEDKYEREIIEMLEQKHGKNYRLFDLESCIQTITLEKLCELCKHIDSWLGSGREKVVVLQDRGDRQRLGTAIAAYLEYQKICGSNFPRSKSFDDRGSGQGTISRNWLDLDIFSMQKFLEDIAGPLRVPSHKRYLQYFSGLLSGNIKMNSSPLFLKYVSIESPPSWMSYNSLNTQSSEWKSFLKIYEGLHCVFTTDIHVVPISTRQFIYEIGNLRLRGDVTVRCYQILLNSNGFNTDQRELMFSVQFHTCAVTERNISFGRADLDYACDDPRFPNDHKLLLNFDGFNESGGNRNLYIQSPLIRIESGNTAVTKWDSFEHLNEEDRHRELDDILTDMLMTVQDIPDFSNSTSPNAISKSHSLSKVQSSTASKLVPISSSISSSVLASSQQNIVNTNTIKRSQSYNNNKNAIQTATNTIESNQLSEGERYNIERDIYDTSSTTTTLTPPPSESGRETPVINYRDKINENHIIMEQHQSFTYPQTGRNDILISEENIHNHNNQNNNTIPYHAREDSRPFSYGNIPTSPQELQQSQSSSGIMLKMQSGLSSPSLVRKHLGINPNSNTLTRKTPPRNDFEEMLRERREKVLSEKYSISDNNNHSGLNSANNNKIYQSDSVNNNNNNSNNKQWYNTLQSSSTVTTNSKSPNQQSNGYHHYHEPLKRSNTMDGGFGRTYSYSTSSSTTSDCVSGQTWLQLQQQKLRAKKEQQQHDDYRPNHYEQRVVRTEILNNQNSRPIRSRSNTSRYNDGYVSDTAAFGNDEVDYRRPLHVQTPHGQSATLNRSNSSLGTHGPERNYNTIQTTTITTTTKERPFVAIKRAHEQAKHHGYNSQPPSALSVLNATPNGHVAQAQNQNGLLSFVDSNSTSNININNSSRNINNNQNNIGHGRLVREESFSSYRSENEQDLSPSMGGSRPETPAFPVTPRTPLFGMGNSSPALPPKSPTSQRRHYNSTWSLRSQKSAMSSYDLSKDLFSGNQTDTSNYTSRRNSTTSNANSEPQEVAAHHVKFVRDSSKYWYKPHLTRDEAVNLLRNAQPGTFIVRDSTTFVNAFGLVIRVSHPPPGVQPKGPPGDELVRHFLIEPTTRGVRLKGCANEPVFTSLSALVYQHSITPLALPCKLIIPDREIDSQWDYNSTTQQQILDQGAACNVLYLFTCDTESLTGPQAVRKGVALLFSRRPLPTPTTVHFKVSRQGITLTDNTRRLFFRKHHPANNITFIGLDPDGHMWSVPSGGETPVSNYKIFAFIAKRSPSSGDNQCHVFCELDPRQPASAIVNYAYKAIPNSEHSVSTRSI